MISTGRRVQPYQSQFESPGSIPPSSIVYTDADGILRPLAVGSNLEITNGTLNVISTSGSSTTYAVNVGTGIGLFSFKDVDTLKFKSITGNAKLIVTEDADNVFLNVVNAADVNHLHYISDVIGLQTDLDNKSNSSHLHDDRYSLISHIHSLASSSLNGFMSIANFNKLTNIEAGAQVNVVTSVASKTGAVVLVANDITNFTSAVTSTVNALSLQDFSDVVITSPSDNEILQYISGNWVNSTNTFLKLLDTPSSFTGQSSKFITVKSAEDGVEFTDTIDCGTF